MKKRILYISIFALWGQLLFTFPGQASIIKYQAYIPAPVVKFWRFKLHPLSTPPSCNNSQIGKLYSNSVDKLLYYCAPDVGWWPLQDPITDLWKYDDDINGQNFVKIKDNATSALVGIGTTTPEFKLTINEGGILAKGTYGAGQTLPGSFGGGLRFFWFPRLALFRAGYTPASQWNGVYLGEFSVGFNYGAQASGYASTAFGDTSEADGDHSTAFGKGSFAKSYGSVAMGRNTVAEQKGSFAAGYLSVAKSMYSAAFGYKTYTLGQASAAFGDESHIEADYSMAFGKNTLVKAPRSVGFGENSDVRGNASSSLAFGSSSMTNFSTGSIAMGDNTTSLGSYSMAVGQTAKTEADYSYIFSGSDYVLGAAAHHSMLIELSNPPTSSFTTPNVLIVWGAGKVGIDVASPSKELHVNGSIGTDPGSGCVCSSDMRLKQDIRPIENALERISQLRGVQFDWNDTHYGAGPQLGLVAQEVEKVFPETVVTLNDGTKAVRYENLTGAVVEAAKELNRDMEEMDAKLKIIEAGNL